MTVTFKEAFENARRGISPHRLWGFWRNFFHAIIGFSPEKARIISAVMILTVVGVLGLISLGLFRSAWLALLPVLAIGLYPNVFMTARSMRMEQEIIFLGCLGLFGLPFLMSRVSSLRLRYLLMVLGGILVGWAATMQPWGVVFALVLFATLLVYPSLWKSEDGASFLGRLLAWGAGVALPGLFVLAQMVANWPYYSEFMAIMSKCYADRAINIAISFYFLPHYILHRQAFYLFPNLLYWGFGIQTLVVLGYALFSLRPGKPRDRIYVVAAAWLAVGFISMVLVYPLNSNYFCYPALGISLGFSWVALTLWERLRQMKSRLSACFSLALLLLLCAQVLVNVSYILYQTMIINRYSRADKLISLDTRFQGIVHMVELTGMNRQKDPIYCDLMTWIGGGRDFGSLYETNLLMVTPAPRKVGGVIIELPSYQGLMLRHGRKFAPPEAKFQRFEDILAPLSLAGVIFDRGISGLRYPKSYHFYQRLESPSPLLYYGIIRGEKDIIWGQSSRQEEISGVYDEHRQSTWRNLPEGLYVLLLLHNDRLDYVVKVINPLDQRELSEVKIAPQPIYRCMQRPVILEVPSGRGNIVVRGLESIKDAVLHRVTLLPVPTGPQHPARRSQVP